MEKKQFLKNNTLNFFLREINISDWIFFFLLECSVTILFSHRPSAKTLGYVCNTQSSLNIQTIACKFNLCVPFVTNNTLTDPNSSNHPPSELLSFTGVGWRLSLFLVKIMAALTEPVAAVNFWLLWYVQ